MVPTLLTRQIRWSPPEYGCDSVKQYTLYYQKKCEKATNDWKKIDHDSLETHAMCAHVPNLSVGDTYVFKMTMPFGVISCRSGLPGGPHRIIIPLEDRSEISGLWSKPTSDTHFGSRKVKITLPSDMVSKKSEAGFK